MRMWHSLRDLLAPRWFIRQRQQISQREAYELPDFIRDLGGDAGTASALWHVLAKEAVVEGFKPHPQDDLLKIYGLADEDLDDVVLTLLKRCDCRIPLPSETAAMPAVNTVADLFAFVASMRRVDQG